MKVTNRTSPNSSPNLQPKGIVLHHTAGGYAGSVSWCMNAAAKVSYHRIVDTNGDATNLVAENRRSWSNGESIFKGRRFCNAFMLNIAVSGDTTKRELTSLEIESVARWCVEMMRKYNFGIDWVTTHREISPRRKIDVDTRAEQAIKRRILELTKAPVQNRVVHIVERGDTLTRIARQYGTTVQKIQNMNGMNTDTILIGQRLVIS